MFSFPLHNYHKLGDLHSRNEFSYSFGGWQSKVRVPAWCVLVSLSSWLADDHFLLSSHGREKSLVALPLFGGVPALSEQCPPRSHGLLQPLSFCSRALFPNTVIFGVRVSKQESQEWEWDTIQSIALSNRIFFHFIFSCLLF